MSTRLQLPTNADIDLLMSRIKGILFPDVFGVVDEEDLRVQLNQYVRFAVEASGANSSISSVEGYEIELPLAEIGDLLRQDIQAAADNDPAASSTLEVMCCYPAFTAMLHYRVAHALYQLNVPLLPRIITERAHSITGIDIHPAAQIGPAFGIDHGTGIVIGATSIIGSHVMVYQGVTLGAKHFARDAEGHMIDQPRHPILEDYVTVYSNTSLLGRIRIGHHSVIGGNLWITHDVPPYSQVRQSRPVKKVSFENGDGI
jgi:serine O-acetyltransferase